MSESIRLEWIITGYSEYLIPAKKQPQILTIRKDFRHPVIGATIWLGVENRDCHNFPTLGLDGAVYAPSFTTVFLYTVALQHQFIHKFLIVRVVALQRIS